MLNIKEGKRVMVGKVDVLYGKLFRGEVGRVELSKRIFQVAWLLLRLASQAPGIDALRKLILKTLQLFKAPRADMS